MRRAILVLLYLLATFALQAQTNLIDNKRAFWFYYGNDVTAQKDHYYTNGVAFALTLPIFEKSPFNPIWLKRKATGNSYHTLTFQYDVFTPKLSAPLYSERPFASTMMIGSQHSYLMRKNSVRLTSSLQLGIIGQATGAGTLQNGLHELMPGADRVEGWETQIRNDLAINYMLSLEKQFHRSRYAEIIGGMHAYLGVPYTKLDFNVLLRIGLMVDYFDLFNVNNERVWQAYFFSGVRTSFVGYNATLQGGLLNSSNPYTLDSIEPIMVDLSYGIGFDYRRVSLILSQHYLTPEFDGGDSHGWGELSLVVRF
jgi:lipid A 3-O-deacylase